MGSKSIACNELTITPRRSLMLSTIPLIREVRRSIPRKEVWEKSASTKSQ